MKQHLLHLLHYLTPGRVIGGLLVLFLIWLVTAVTRRGTNVTVLMPGGASRRGGLSWKAGLLSAVAVVLGLGWAYHRLRPAAAKAVQAAPVPPPSPAPLVTVTHNAVQVVHDSAALAGWEVALIACAALGALVAVVKLVGRYFGS